MHRFWGIDELVRVLVVDLQQRCEASASAIALACCSKRLEGVVLDCVWGQLTGLSLLMQCLPPGTWERRGGEFVSGARSRSRTSEAYCQ